MENILSIPPNGKSPKIQVKSFLKTLAMKILKIVGQKLLFPINSIRKTTPVDEFCFIFLNDTTSRTRTTIIFNFQPNDYQN